MLNDKELPSANFDRFIARALAAGEIYGLHDKDGGWAVCPSREDDEIDVILVWSDKSAASRQAKEEWADYRIAEIGLEEFVASWLRGMHEEGSLVGPDWDENLSGPEIEAIEMAKRLTEDEAAT